MKRIGGIVVRIAMLAALAAVLAAHATAHQTKATADGKFLVSVGFLREPIFTDERNGLDILVRRADDGQPVEHLQDTLFAEIVAPDGVTKRVLALRAQHGQPGRYTADILLTVAGHYKLRIWGYIQDAAFDEVFDLHEVLPLATLRFPG